MSIGCSIGTFSGFEMPPFDAKEFTGATAIAIAAPSQESPPSAIPSRSFKLKEKY